MAVSNEERVDLPSGISVKIYDGSASVDGISYALMDAERDMLRKKRARLFLRETEDGFEVSEDDTGSLGWIKVERDQEFGAFVIEMMQTTNHLDWDRSVRGWSYQLMDGERSIMTEIRCEGVVPVITRTSSKLKSGASELLTDMLGTQRSGWRWNSPWL